MLSLRLDGNTLICPVLATAITDEKILRLFRRHFAEPEIALLRLERHLASVPLSFDLKAQIRELIFPSMPGLPQAQESFVYYYLPCSGWGSDKIMPSDPLDPDFVNVTDGVSLNLGCPVRLLRALDTLARLRPEDQHDVKGGLRNPTQHFATIEELLWTAVWRSPSDLRRGGTLPGTKGNVVVGITTYDI